MENSLTIRSNAAIATAESITEELGRQFVEYLDVKPQTVATYRASIRKFFLFLAQAGITAPTRADILAYKNELKRHCKPATVTLHITATRLFFQWTKQQGLYPDITEHVKGEKIEDGFKRDYLEQKQVQDILTEIDRSTTQGKRDYAIFSLMVTTGVRRVEIVRANIEDIDGDRFYLQGKGSGEKSKYSKIAPGVERAIAEYLEARGETDKTAPLFVSDSNNSKGERITTRSITRLVKQRMRNVGINNGRLTAHSLRHTAATINLLNGGSYQETQQMLRHRNINTTMLYSHALERAKNNSESRIAAAIGI